MCINIYIYIRLSRGIDNFLSLSLSLPAENAIPVCDVSALDEIVAIKVGSLREILCGNVDN